MVRVWVTPPFAYSPTAHTSAEDNASTANSWLKMPLSEWGTRMTLFPSQCMSREWPVFSYPPTIQTSFEDTAARPYSTAGSVAGTVTRCQAVPSKCSTIGSGFENSLRPTAQASVADRAETATRVLLAVPPFGLGTTSHAG